MNIQQREQILDVYSNQRSRCLVYTRVMGYHRPVESFNIGKKGEHRQRQYFTEK
jgi:anaerobic ribonucleoside-triphosphate reductase